MTASLPPLLGLTAFEAAARRGSFAGAARELHLSSSAVSHRVKVLELHLGHPLFERRARSLRLTDHGRAYLPVVQGALDGLAQGTDGVFGTLAPSVDVTIRVPVSYGARLLGPQLPTIQESTGLRVKMVSSVWGPGGVDMEVDLAVEFDLDVADPLGGEVSAVLVDNPHNTSPSVPAQRVEVLGFEHHWADDALIGTGFPMTSLAGTRVDTWSTAMEIVATSVGWCTLVPAPLIHRAIRGGWLRDTGISVPLPQRFGIQRRHGEPSPPVQAFVDCLRSFHEEMAQHPSAGRGTQEPVD